MSTKGIQKRHRQAQPDYLTIQHNTERENYTVGSALLTRYVGGLKLMEKVQLTRIMLFCAKQFSMLQ